MSMLITPGRTRPEPLAPEQEEEVRKSLKELDSLLDIKWLPYCRMGSDGELEGRYALICTWPAADGRWKLYRSGDIGEPFDILGYYEVGMDGRPQWFGQGNAEEPHRPVDPREVHRQALELLGKMDNTREPWKDRVRKVAEENAALRERRRKEAADEMLQGMKYYRQKVQGKPLLPGASMEGQEAPETEEAS